MKPLVILLLSFVCLLLIGKYTDSYKSSLFAGNFAMSIMLLFTAMGHFKFKTSMAAMLPLFIPKKTKIITLTGILEVLFAIGLSLEVTRYYTGLAIILFLLLILPANIYSAKNKINYENLYKAGPGVKYLWFRIPFQFFLMAWVWYFSVR
ncbi:hypothetical protein EZJ43_09895 [Pedobacter changchengzhani]|uniref:DoxX family membrane protein n=1 Tax=Pedobacter changchengzhani TaxID=2529274 RepID=A0A4R5MK40_9SPHI|nr:hypothetical protein [Pedobacter changchengzhani]TDG35991.1 hypothetical protein EZJ43_09895 [Pedobacter changchengzhani]